MDALGQKERTDDCRSRSVAKDIKAERVGAADDPHPSQSNSATSSLAFPCRGEITVQSEQWLKKESQLDDSMTSQLSFILDSKDCYFGGIKTLADCFHRRHIDDGAVFYLNLACSSAEHNLHYWQGCFGGNPTGYLLTKDISTATVGTSSRSRENGGNWIIIVENCDGDFIWKGSAVETAPPAGFIKQIKMAVYGDKYDTDEEE